MVCSLGVLQVLRSLRVLRGVPACAELPGGEDVQGAEDRDADHCHHEREHHGVSPSSVGFRSDFLSPPIACGVPTRGASSGTGQTA